MLQKIKTALALLLLLAGSTAGAQPVFHITASPVDSTLIGSGQPMDEVEPTTYLVNQTSNPIQLRWQLITTSASYAADWIFWGAADNLMVRAPEPSPFFDHDTMVTDVIQPGDSSQLKIIVRIPATSPNGSNGFFKIKVFDSLQTQVDTAVFRICKGGGCTFPPYSSSGGGTGMNKLQTSTTAFTLYPNPATDKAYISLSNPKPLPPGIRAELYDYTGRLLLQQALDATATIDLHNIHPGMYMIRLYQRDQYLGSQKISRL